MECDTLFAESDDEVEVLPSTLESAIRANDEQITKPVSSNYVNSTTPNKFDRDDLNSFTYPASSHTPVPEEYQPLPDSSGTAPSAFYDGTENIPDSTHTTNQRLRPNINMHYQPKPSPLNRQSYYYPNYGHYTNLGPSNDYFALAPYHTNNVIVLNDNRNYVSHPLTYTMAPNHAGVAPNNLRRSNTVYNQEEPVPDNEVNSSQSGDNLERPSRKLNISPRRRQSKENEAVTNLIEVSSEEEDNASAPKKRSCDNRTAAQMHINALSTNSTDSQTNSSSGQANIKIEPRETSVNQLISNGSNTRSSMPERRQSNHNCPHICKHHSHQNDTSHLVKQEQGTTHNHCNCNAGNRHNTSNSTRMMPSGQNNNELVVTNLERQTPVNASRGGILTNPLPHLKEEPGRSTQIKQEVDRQSPQMAHSQGIKTEVLKMPLLKTEPTCCSPRNLEVNGPVFVKSEIEEPRRCCEIEAGGDRQANERSPQPGTSKARCVQPSQNASTSTSKEQTTQGNDVFAETNVLSAPDLQLDWVSDSGSDDDVLLLSEENNVLVKFLSIITLLYYLQLLKLL